MIMSFSSFWKGLLPHSDDSVKWENITIDVISKGCFYNFNTLACVGNGTLAVIGLVTLLLCIYRVIRLHVLRHRQFHHYFIFYFASVECILLITDWVIGKKYPQLEYVATFLQLLQFVLLCHFQWALVTRILHHEKLIFWVIIPVLILCCISFTSVGVLGIVSPKSTWVECLEPHWLLLSLVEFFIVQLSMTAGIYIHRKINSVSALESFKREQKIELWSVILAYETSAIVSLVQNVVYRILGNKRSGCSGIYDHQQVLYTPIIAIYMIINYLLPIWALVIFYRPARGYMSSDEERLLGLSGDGSSRSISSIVSKAPLLPKQIYSSYHEQDVASSYFPTLRRSQTSPALLSTSFRPSSLAPISEEYSSRIACSSQTTHSNINKHLLIQQSESPPEFSHNLELSGESNELLV